MVLCNDNYIGTSRSPPPQVTVEGLQKRFNISDDQLDKMIEQSDVRYLASCFGDVELYLPSLGLKESQNADVRRAVRDHGNEIGMNKALTSWINWYMYNATFRELITITLRTPKAIVAMDIFKYLKNVSFSCCISNKEIII